MISCRKNTYEVSLGDLDENLLTIKVFNNNEGVSQVIYSNGVIEAHQTYYGENDWTIYYDNDELFNFREFVKNRNNFSHYCFTIIDKEKARMGINGKYVTNQK